jgi:hypothetical protein
MWTVRNLYMCLRTQDTEQLKWSVIYVGMPFMEMPAD